MKAENMKIYLIERTDYCGYDMYDSAVVAEKTPKKAMKFCERFFNKDKMSYKLIGRATNKQRKGLILASFNAG